MFLTSDYFHSRIHLSTCNKYFVVHFMFQILLNHTFNYSFSFLLFIFIIKFNTIHLTFQTYKFSNNTIGIFWFKFSNNFLVFIIIFLSFYITYIITFL